ncbi:hypothetical protein BXY58_2432 [Epilithonimonas arachidiradicis]|uniref:Uncharacterized protein n=1 Tax=Epilithonimonas arachidiradicis TaxID=1617282 RepID=A0A420D7R8_9FLAO|nr:hypothetical protein BXY58_2432 [Epilithonimonas arachidiradicis]
MIAFTTSCADKIVHSVIELYYSDIVCDYLFTKGTK